jgi:hypothetical protein
MNFDGRAAARLADDKIVGATYSRYPAFSASPANIFSQAFSPDHAVVIDLGAQPVAGPVELNGHEVGWQGRKYEF